MKKILVATDFGKQSTMALQTANIWAEKLQAKVSLVHVNDHSFAPLSSKEGANLEKDFLEFMDRAGVETKRVEVMTLVGNAIESVQHFISQCVNEMDMLILGDHPQKQISHPMHGGFNEKMISSSPVPTVLVKEGVTSLPKRILLACDFSPLNEKALEWVIHLAQSFGSKIYLVHFLRLVPDDFIKHNLSHHVLTGRMEESLFYPEKTFADERLERMKVKAFGRNVDCEYKTIIELADPLEREVNDLMESWEIDLLVLGKHSLNLGEVSGVKHPIGRTALHLGRHGSKSLAIYNG